MPLPQFLKAQDSEDQTPTPSSLVPTSSSQHAYSDSGDWLPTSTTPTEVPKPKKEIVSKPKLQKG